VRKEWKLRDSLSLVNDEAIPVGIAKRRPMANLRFSRSEEEGDIVFAQCLTAPSKSSTSM